MDRQTWSAVGVLLFLIPFVFFQNCGLSQMSSNHRLNTVSQIQDTQLKGFTAPNCSLPQAIQCARDEVVVRLTNSDGCQYNSCQTASEASCPKFITPTCNTNEVLVREEDNNGCVVPKCEPKPSEFCSQANADIMCGANEYKTVAYNNRKRCIDYTCRPNTDYICLEQEPLNCADGKVEVSYKSPNGCEAFQCKDIPGHCPVAYDLTCGEGESLFSVGDNNNGCPRYECRESAPEEESNSGNGNNDSGDGDREISGVTCNNSVPICNSRQELELTIENGCREYKCVNKDRENGPRCPVFDDHDDCVPGAQLTSTLDINGCTVPVCEYNDSLFCTSYNDLDCRSDQEKASYQDGLGCTHHKCLDKVYDFCERNYGIFYNAFWCNRNDR